MFFGSDILIINYKFICTLLFLDQKMEYKSIYNLYFTLKFHYAPHQNKDSSNLSFIF